MLNPPSAIAFKKIISFYSKDTLGDPKKSLQSNQTMNFILRISMAMHGGGRNSKLRSQNFRNDRKCPIYIWLCILVFLISVILTGFWPPKGHNFDLSLNCFSVKSLSLLWWWFLLYFSINSSFSISNFRHWFVKSWNALIRFY